MDTGLKLAEHLLWGKLLVIRNLQFWPVLLFQQENQRATYKAWWEIKLILHWWVLILHETNYNWSVAVLTVTEHFIYSHFWFHFQIGCFLQWIQSVYPHLFSSLYDNGSPLYSGSPSGLLCWLILIVNEVVLNLLYPSIFSGLAALMSSDIARNLWSLVCSCLNCYWIFHLFPHLIFFQIG